MAEASNLIGQKFGRLTVIDRAEKYKDGHAMWLCRCECGTEKVILEKCLKNGKTKSCGCLRKEITVKRLTKHGLNNIRLYDIWSGIKQRCYNSKRKGFGIYGGRGIIMCDEWENNFMSFYDWAMANGYADNLSIDRIDVNGNYCPENCRWATFKEQMNNMRTNRFLTYNGETHTMAEWGKILNISDCTLYSRLKRGWTVEKTLSTPVRQMNKNK